MANTYVDYVGSDGTGTGANAGKEFLFTFPYIKTSHVVVEINQGPAGGLNKWERTTAFTVETSPSTRVVLDTVPNSLWKIRVLRDSDASTGLVDFANGSVLTETELDNSYEHNRYLAEEAEEGITGGSLVKNTDGQFDADGLRLENLADPDSDDDAVNKGYADGRYVNESGDTMTGVLTLADADPTNPNDAARKSYVDSQIAAAVFTGTPGGQIDTVNIADGAITTAKIEDGAVTADKISSTDEVFSLSKGIDAQSTLKVKGTSNDTGLFGAGGGTLLLVNDSNGVNEYCTVRFQNASANNTSHPTAEIRGVNGGPGENDSKIRGFLNFLVTDGLGTLNEALFITGGDTATDPCRVGINTKTPGSPLEVNSTAGGVILPRLTNTQMNAVASPTNGEMIYNTTDNKFYGYANGAWVALH